MTETVFTSHGFTIDLTQLCRAMYDQSVINENGERAFHGNSKNVRSVKRLLNDLFGVPVADKMHPVNHAIRSQARDRLAALRWAQKDDGRSARYVRYRDL